MPKETSVRAGKKSGGGILSTIALFLVLLTGIGIVLYPTVSDYWNALHQSRAIAGYSAEVAKTSAEDYTAEWEAALAYNRSVPLDAARFHPTEEETERYNSLLNVGGTGIMGYIEIPVIKVSLPLYHGTDESVLQIAVGHIEGTSLPTGGTGTHSVFSGHRGLPSAKLFTNLDEMQIGDQFVLRVLDEVLTYEVDQILIVLPHEMEALNVDPEKDYCTLVTCTPYGINTHRLLVRGHRVANAVEAAAIRVTADAQQVDQTLVAVALSVPLLLLLIVIMLIWTGYVSRQNRRRRAVYARLRDQISSGCT